MPSSRTDSQSFPVPGLTRGGTRFVPGLGWATGKRSGRDDAAGAVSASRTRPWAPDFDRILTGS